MPDIWIGASASFVCTTLGAVPALMLKNVSHRGKDVLLAYTAGIMVAASTYGLIPSSLKLSNLWVLTAGILAGTLILTLIEMFLPHTDLDNTTENHNRLDSGLLLFLTAMSIHNIPEGLSVGLSYASDQGELGHLVALAIGLQNVPEGFLVAVYLLTQGVHRFKSFLFAGLTGLFEMLAYFIGYQFSSEWEPVIPFGLAFAAGAMLFVVYKELIPESHGDGHERTATFSFILGLLTMIVLSEIFG
ncbi:ZIP family metal transporter [Gorillibacterium sp. sgz5001074]|uniref:ZIP family metal transporter n=1 Tax=Gorillibacterium sp. sgz5001074 TaxID=3446695 RepID=UPI003F677CA6